ncbi:conserved hypothetical protein [Leishmania mexicana MHOM/GT/2001/U1103]|uniref:Uncharacterized protein n=1 Tax=Leishmania mexicana (strain MHOM/GT/2001/U1103) TaxID=929439 RepID=E9AUN8_LEIMU|nr:conserved hypothetical protein [Leishmania mexicana MHOM/GT/2001/U1103]CBZ26667.1 conserved hypothetical protein [Leishmania mexicana MHOM/GT/2001/U1103]
MELHPLETAAVRILFCGRPALTTGIVNLRVLLGGDGQYCLAEKRKAKLYHSSRHGTQGDAAVSNGVEASVDSEEKRESVYRVCSSEGLPDGCYHVKADRHYWVMHTKGGFRAAVSTTATAATPTQPSASLWNTQGTLASSSMPLAATASTAGPSKVEEDVLARSTQDQGTAASAPAEAADATAVTVKSSSALTPADDAARASVARKQKVVSMKRKDTRRLKAVEEGMDKLPLITTTFSNLAPLAEASPTQEQQQQGASMRAVDVVGDVEAALGEQPLGIPLSAQQSATVATDVFVACEEAPLSRQQQQQQEKHRERRKKTSRVHVDAVTEEGKSSEAAAAGSRVSTKKTRDSSRAGGGSDFNGEVGGGMPLVEQLAADASQPPKKPQHRGKRRRSDEVTAEDPPALPPVRHPSTQVKSLTSSLPETSPLPTPEKSKAARRKMDLRQDEVAASAPASSADLRDATLPQPSTVTDSDTESAPTPASPARKSRKSSAATSAASAAATSDAADTATLSKIPTPPLSPLPLRPVASGRQITSPHAKTPSHAGTNTASLAHPPSRQAPPPSPQQQQEEEHPLAKRSPASVPQETTPNILYSNRSSGVVAPTAGDIVRQQQHDRHSALNSPSTRSQVGANRSASTSSLLEPLLSPLLQRRSQWGGIGGGAAGPKGLREGMMNGGSGGGGFFPSDSPALGFTQVHSTLAEEFSLDVSETESSSAASEYLYDVEE